MNPAIDLPPGVKTAIEFNTYRVPAELGIEMPPQAASCVLNISEEQFIRYRDWLEDQLRADAARLLAERFVAAAVERLPLPKAGLVMAIGDSLTAYRRSYVDLLRAMIQLRRPGDSIRFANRAQSGYTSTHARRSTYTQYILEQPDLLFVLLGGNDCERFGGPGAPTLVTPGEYRDNIAAIVRAFRAHTPARIVLLSPVPVIPSLMARVQDFARQRLTWDNTDLQVTADVLRSLALEYQLSFVDLMEVFGPRPEPSLYFLDGIHPGPGGQELILRQLLEVFGGA